MQFYKPILLPQKEQKLISSWLSFKQANSTARNYERAVKAFFAFCPVKTLRDVRPGHLSDFFLKSQSESLARNRRNALSSLFSYCAKIGYLAPNPFDMMEPQKPLKRSEIKILSPEDVSRMIQHEPSMRNRSILEVLYYCGLRVGEICKLTWSNFFIDTQGQARMIVAGRTVAIPARVWQPLSVLKQNSCGAVFSSQKEPYDNIQPNQVRRLVARAGQRAGLSFSVSPSILRQTHAVHALRNGASVGLVEKTLDLSSAKRWVVEDRANSSSTYLD